MEGPMTAIEVAGMIDEQRQLHLQEPLPISGPVGVRVIVMYPSVEPWDETEWLRAAAINPAFEDLLNPEEDIYSLADGKPFHDQA